MQNETGSATQESKDLGSSRLLRVLQGENPRSKADLRPRGAYINSETGESRRS